MVSENSDIINCPSCGWVAQPDDKFCPNCGIQLNAVNLSTNGSKTNLEYFYWENRGDLGYFRAFWKTVIEATIFPVRFFSGISAGKNLAMPLTFYIIITLLSMALGFSKEYIFPEKNTISVTEINKFSGEHATIVTQNLNSFSPLMVPVGITMAIIAIFVISGITQLLLRLLGWASNGFEATFRVELYAFTPLILSYFPVVAYIVPIWSLAISVIGLKQLQKISIRQAIIVELLPIFSCLVFFVIIMLLFWVKTGKNPFLAH
jgi:hypothetical protein